ncbi:MAG TPA: glutamate mutase L [Clostridia bacterium]|nr:glutamate mutase L [Clostridia bacterium]
MWGGATTDVHSVTEGSDAIQRILVSPEPLAKRTVEGDLGVFVNLPHVVERIGIEELKKEFGNEITGFLEQPKAIPENEMEKRIVERLALEAAGTAVSRHAGKLRYLYGPSGKKTIAQGKDLTRVKFIIATGGALTRLPGRNEIIKKLLFSGKDTDLYPPVESKILIDNYYIMASLGVMWKKHENAAMYLMKKSLGLI